MKSISSTFGSSILAYALITIPCIFFPPMYFLSLIIAIILAVAALLPYSLFFYWIKKVNLKLKFKWFLLLAFIPIVLLITYLLMLFTDYKSMMLEFIAFPCLAIISTWIGMYMNRKLIQMDIEILEIELETELELNHNF